MIITCRTCKEDREQAVGQRSNICGACWKVYRKAYVAKNRDLLLEKERARNTVRKSDPVYMTAKRKRNREYWQELRHETIMAYGGYRCACCGEAEPHFLSIDHVFNDGAAHRRSLGYEGNGKGGGSQTMKWLKDHGFPAGFQVLCMNCNHGKARNGGVCPHKTSQANRVKTGEAQTG